MSRRRCYLAFIIIFLGTMATTHAQTPDGAMRGSTSALKTSPPQAGLPPVPVRVVESSMKTFALRLLPGMDIKEELERIVKERNVKAALVLTCVGSLRDAVVRFANKPAGTELRGPLEIVSLMGTIAQDGSHLHIALSDREGVTIGGHILAGCRVFTTAEIVLGVLTDAAFKRELDETSDYKELVITPLTGKK